MEEPPSGIHVKRTSNHENCRFFGQTPKGCSWGISEETISSLKILRACLNNQNVLFYIFLKIFEWYLCNKYRKSNHNFKSSYQTFLDRLLMVLGPIHTIQYMEPKIISKQRKYLSPRFHSMAPSIECTFHLVLIFIFGFP